MLSSKVVGGLRPVWHSARILSRPLSSAYLQHRFGACRANASVANPAKIQGENSSACRQPAGSGDTLESNQTRFDPAEPRLAIAFTCTADGCHHRSAHTFTKRAYERGIVIIQCPSCKNRHLIADNLGWFKDDTEDGRLRNVEDILGARGEHVQRGTLNANGTIEVSDSDTVKSS